MNSVHHYSAPERTGIHSGLATKTAAQLNGFTWSHDSLAPQATTSSVPQDDATRDDEQPRMLYSKLYERFIEKREVFVHSNIDVRRNVTINQAQTRHDQARRSTTPQHCSNISSPNSSLITNYPMVAKIESSPRDEGELLHGYWEFSDRSSPNYYSTGPSVLRAPVAVADSSFPLMHRSSPPPPSHSHHQPLPARFHSSYSELSANVAFMCEPKSQLTSSSRDSTRSNSESQSRPPTPAVTHPTLQHTSCSRIPPPAEPPTLNRSDSVPQSRHASRRKNKTEVERQGGSSSPHASGNKVLSGRKGSDVRRQSSLACFFCRGRKIACGRPAEGSTDRTCNQCAQRAYLCNYPTESMRGQHKRRKTNKTPVHHLSYYMYL